MKALALFSGGLDSILACRVIMDQGIAVEAIQFVTPFFNDGLLTDVAGHKARMLEKFGIDVHVEDISPGYLRLLHRPAHGFGKYFNPCIDCKIFMFSRAKAMLTERGASFLITGEVLGQRPMSQRRDTLNLIERDSGTRSLLLRPLCAQLMSETLPEQKGWVDRRKLLRMSGRGRSAQLALAKQYGITDFPAPAGGCILADPVLSRRIAHLYAAKDLADAESISATDIRMLLIGRQFHLPGGGWLILGRDEEENTRLTRLAGGDDLLLLMEDWPGPTAVLKKATSAYPEPQALADALSLAAALVVRYGKKRPAPHLPGEVTVHGKTMSRKILAQPLDDAVCRDWAMG
jgi:hypothetical protein